MDKIFKGVRPLKPEEKLKKGVRIIAPVRSSDLLVIVKQPSSPFLILMVSQY